MQGQTNYRWAREAAKWGADFMARSTEEDRVLLHIGDIRKDHNYIGRAELYPQIDRNIRYCEPGMSQFFYDVINLLGCMFRSCNVYPTVLFDAMYKQHDVYIASLNSMSAVEDKACVCKDEPVIYVCNEYWQMLQHSVHQA